MQPLPKILLLIVMCAPSLAASSAVTQTKLKFSPTAADQDYRLVSPTDSYSKTLGFGFESAGKMHVEAGGFIASDQPFYFSISEPEGNYKVTVELGDSSGSSETTIKAELRRLMIENVKTENGQIASRSFIVNVRTPVYPDGKVKLKSPREDTAEAWAWDDKLTLEFNGKHPCLRSLTIEKVEVPTVYLLGDSTVCDQSAEPYASWGQMLPRFLSLISQSQIMQSRARRCDHQRGLIEWTRY